MLNRDDRVDLEIESLAYEGSAVARHDGLVVFVPLGVPGDRVRVRITKRRRRYVEGEIEAVLRPSPVRVDAPCHHFGTCGGCRLQNVEYSEQLLIKEQQVRSLLQKIGGQDSPVVLPTLPSPNPYYYRNKMEFSCGPHRWVTREEIEAGLPLERDFALGLHIPKRFDRILDIRECRLQSERSARIVNRVREWAREYGWAPYDAKAHQGFLRHLVIREAAGTGQLLVAVVATEFVPGVAAALKGLLLEQEPGITTLVYMVNPTRSPVSSGLEEVALHGPGWIEERIGDLSFRIDPGSFFQPNSLQAPVLFDVIRQYAGLDRDMRAYDLFCGVGSIALWVARDAGSVLGVESYAGAVRLAEENARRNRIVNCAFETGDAADALKPEAVSRHGRPDVVILDPPRAGLHPDLVRRLVDLRVPRIVYSSCNPATQARDISLLAAAYQLDSVQPVDMFPQTYHIEAVARLNLAE